MPIPPFITKEEVPRFFLDTLVFFVLAIFSAAGMVFVCSEVEIYCGSFVSTLVFLSFCLGVFYFSKRMGEKKMNDIGKFQRDIQILTAELQEWDSIYRYTSVPHTKKQAQAQMEELQNKIQKLQKEIQILQGDNNV